jgi:hypothetical protein
MEEKVLEKIRQLEEQAKKLKGQPYVKTKSNVRDSLSEIIKTQEQADHLMMQLKALINKNE